MDTADDGRSMMDDRSHARRSLAQLPGAVRWSIVGRPSSDTPIVRFAPQEL